MKLETADQFSERSQITLMEARQVRAAFEAGQKCCECSQRATVRRGGEYLCALDAQVADQRARRESMRRA